MICEHTGTKLLDTVRIMVAPGSKRDGKETRANTASTNDPRGTHIKKLKKIKKYRSQLKCLSNRSNP